MSVVRKWIPYTNVISHRPASGLWRAETLLHVVAPDLRCLCVLRGHQGNGLITVPMNQKIVCTLESTGETGLSTYNQLNDYLSIDHEQQWIAESERATSNIHITFA